MVEPTDIQADTDLPLTRLPLPPEEEPSENGSVVKAATILAAGNVISRLLGLAREIVKASLFGASGLLSAFEVAAYVPTSLYDLIIGGMVNSALVPVFSDYASKEKREQLWGVLSTVLSVATVLLLLVVGLVELFAPQIAWVVGADEFSDPELKTISIQLMRMAAPAVLFLSVGSILTGALYALKRFTIPAFMGAIFNGTIVIIALLFPEHITSLVWGLLLGSLLQIVVQLPALRDAKLRWRLDFRHPAVRQISILYAPILAGLVVNQAAVALSYNLATRTGDTSISYMKYATTLYQFPLGLVVTALSIATLPTLSRQASGQLTEFKQTLSEGIRLVLALILPATVGLFALALPIAGLLFQRGAFTSADSEITARVLQVYLVGLPFAAVDQMLVFASYARKDTWRPALVGVISIVIYSITAVLLLQPLSLLSLMVADAVKHICHTAMMLFVMRHHIGGIRGYGIGPTAVKSLFAAAVMGIVAYAVGSGVALLVDPAGFSGKLIIVLAGGLAGLSVYALFAWFTMRDLVTLVRRR